MKGPLSFLIAAFAAAGVAYAGIAPSSPPSAGSPSAPAGLSLNADCATNKLTVTIDVTPQGGNVINAGQYFLDFDTAALDFQLALAGEPPFDFIIMPPDVDEGAGTIEGFATGSLVEPGSDQPKTMAVLVFDVVNAPECVPLEDLVRWQDPPAGEPRTMLTLAGGELFEPDPLEHLGPVIVDTQAPMIGAVTVEPGEPCELVVSFEADVTDNCCLDMIKVNVPDPSCAEVGNISTQFWPIDDGYRVSGTVEFSNLTSCPCTIEVEIIATDCCGQQSSNSGSLDLEDSTAPVFTPVDDISVNADAGYCTAMVTMTATATDNCDGPFDPADIDFIIDADSNGPGGGDDVCSGSPCTYEFPQGTTNVYAVATDSCDNTGMDFFTVTVSEFNEMVLTLGTQTIAVPECSRCIHFELAQCGGGASGNDTVDIDIPFTTASPPGNGSFTGTVLIPCGLWDCITAEDKLHSLRRAIVTPNFTIVGTQYVATFPDPLLGGNYDEFLNYPNPFVDVGDFSVWAAEYQAVATYNSPCPGSPDGCTVCDPPNFPIPGAPHADGNCDGYADLFDFTFIQINWLERHEDCCGNSAPLLAATPSWGTHDSAAASAQLPILQLNVAALAAEGHGELAAADLNEDGWIDVVDVIIVMLGQMEGTGLP
ncbi:MAG: hypothetical protein ACYSWT_08000 [Planctomycetota bacterium]|jgi:hypothetical protein